MTATVADTSRRSDALFAEALRVLPGGVNSPVRAFGAVGGTPRFIRSGAGAWLEDADGNRLLDLVLSWGPLVLGHAHPEVVAAIAETAALGTTYGAPTELEVRLAERVIATFPSIEMVRFVSSGTEAVMSAVRLARAATGRALLVKFDGCYHGHADATLGAAGTIMVPFNDLDAVEDAFHTHRGRIAAVLVEPVAGNMGVVPPEPGFLEGLRAMTERSGALLLFDEVMTGWRVHPRGAQTLYGVTPDITCLGKVVGGGLPAAAYGGRRDLMEMIAPAGPVYQAGTLSGNPLAMAAGLATLDVLEREGSWQRAATWAENAASAVRTAAERASVPIQVQRVGTMLTAFFSEAPIRSHADASAADRAAFAHFFHAMLHRGVYLPPSPLEAAFTSTAHGADELTAFEAALAPALEAVRDR